VHIVQRKVEIGIFGNLTQIRFYTCCFNMD
jgi:hypothetical protein